MTPTEQDKELREKLTCIMGGCIGSHENCLYETIEDAEIGSAEEVKQMVDMQILLIEAYVTTRIKEAIELARSKDPNLCEYGHEVYSHNTVDGWCCACDADQAFMEAEIQERVKEAYDEGYSDGRRKRPTGGNKTYGVGA